LEQHHIGAGLGHRAAQGGRPLSQRWQIVAQSGADVQRHDGQFARHQAIMPGIRSRPSAGDPPPFLIAGGRLAARRRTGERRS
jgi:hypothetical protein